MSSANETISASSKKNKKNQPKVDSPKEWTEAISPLRVIKVPKMVIRNVKMIKTIFQTFNISLFSWIITECR